ncbi:MAG: class I SAM-dependent methyltransferase [Planctomycetota bacterium]|jgi:SAM-dependent methyltransferase
MTYARGEENIARMYEADYAVHRRTADVEFYVEEAQQRGGPVAEFACGTGRVLIPTVRAGVEVTGIDVSPAMLAQARANLASEGLAAELVEGDMRSVELGRTFRLVTMPFRPFQHMIEIQDQLAALDNVRGHLEPGGTLLFDVFAPNLARIAKGGDEDHLELERPDRDGGVVRRHVRTVGEPWRQLIHVHMRWESEPSGEVVTAQFDMRWFTRAEMEHLLARTGYTVEAVYGSFAREPVARDSRDFIFVARPR